MTQADSSLHSRAGAPGSTVGGVESPHGSNSSHLQNLWRRLVRRDNEADTNAETPAPVDGDTTSARAGDEDEGSRFFGPARRVARNVVTGLPRSQTFKRQQSEVRYNLEAVQPTPAERRNVSMDRRGGLESSNIWQGWSDPRTSAPEFMNSAINVNSYNRSFVSVPNSPADEQWPMNQSEYEASCGGSDAGSLDLRRLSAALSAAPGVSDTASASDNHSITTSQYDGMIREELEKTWILNLSMFFRDRSKREKFFVTYRQSGATWRRVTVSLDYRNAAADSLEMELMNTQFQRDKSAKIYEAIRESLNDIQFYDTVTNLKLQTTDGRLHVHVVEDVNEIIRYPTVRAVQHMRCRHVRERDIKFESHLSGFVYKVGVHGQVLIKKEIPSPDTVEEFLYEINALNRLRDSQHVIEFYGLVVDDSEENVKGLLISYAGKGALIDIIYDHDHTLPWSLREKWARQIVGGLSEIHEAGFVQGDFTLSNIVIDDKDDAKIIDINRRGCPVGWEPPEASQLIESGQKIAMYIGVKSDLYQLGMVLWSLATEEDEPEACGRPLRLEPDVNVPAWYGYIVDICLRGDPRERKQASYLLSIFPAPDERLCPQPGASVSHRGEYPGELDVPAGEGPTMKTPQPPSDPSVVSCRHDARLEDQYYYPPRGRSPPSPGSSSNVDKSLFMRRRPTWSDHITETVTVPSISGARPEAFEAPVGHEQRGQTPDSPQTHSGSQATEGPSRTEENLKEEMEETEFDGKVAGATQQTQETQPGHFGQDVESADPVAQRADVPHQRVLMTDQNIMPAYAAGNTVPERSSSNINPMESKASAHNTHEGGGGGVLLSRAGIPRIMVNPPAFPYPSSSSSNPAPVEQHTPNDFAGIGSVYDFATDSRQTAIKELELGELGDTEIDLTGPVKHGRGPSVPLSDAT